MIFCGGERGCHSAPPSPIGSCLLTDTQVWWGWVPGEEGDPAGNRCQGGNPRQWRGGPANPAEAADPGCPVGRGVFLFWGCWWSALAGLSPPGCGSWAELRWGISEAIHRSVAFPGGLCLYLWEIDKVDSPLEGCLGVFHPFSVPGTPGPLISPLLLPWTPSSSVLPASVCQPLPPCLGTDATEKEARQCPGSGEPGLAGSLLDDGASQMSLAVKNPPANARDIRDAGSIPGLGRSPGGGHGHPLQYSCLENPMDRGC